MSEPSARRAESNWRALQNDHEGQSAASILGAQWRILTLCLGSLIVMVPWPLLGIMLTRSYFDKGSEAFMLFGGITLFPLMILALFGHVSEVVFIVLFMLVWLSAAVVPTLWFRRRLTSWRAVAVLLVAQVGYSIAQAAVGALLILTKHV